VGSGYYPFLSPGVHQPLPFLSAPVATKCLALGILPPWKTRNPLSKGFQAVNSGDAKTHLVLVVRSGIEKKIGVFEYLKISL